MSKKSDEKLKFPAIYNNHNKAIALKSFKALFYMLFVIDESNEIDAIV